MLKSGNVLSRLVMHFPDITAPLNCIHANHRVLNGRLHSSFIIFSYLSPSTYDHRVWKTGLPVRSAVLKPHAGRLVVGWVTTSESRLLYVFLLFNLLSILAALFSTEVT